MSACIYAVCAVCHCVAPASCDAVIMYWFPRVWEGQEGVALDDDRVTKVKRAPYNVWRVIHHDNTLFQFLDAARKAASSGGDETAAMDEFEAEALSLKVLACTHVAAIAAAASAGDVTGVTNIISGAGVTPRTVCKRARRRSVPPRSCRHKQPKRR